MTAKVQGSDWARAPGTRMAVWLGAAAFMLLPLLAVESIDELAADPGDFIFLAILLGGIGIAYEVAARTPERMAYQVALGIAVVTALLSAWINLAVGIIGSEDNPANLVYAGVLAIGAVGAVVARFRPRGMAATMVVTAAAQALTFVVMLIAGLGFTGPITIFFVMLWLISAGLFRRAAGASTT